MMCPLAAWENPVAIMDRRKRVDTGAERRPESPGKYLTFSLNGAAHLITIQVEVKDVHSKGIIKSKRWN